MSKNEAVCMLYIKHLFKLPKRPNVAKQGGISKQQNNIRKNIHHSSPDVPFSKPVVVWKQQILSLPLTRWHRDHRPVQTPAPIAIVMRLIKAHLTVIYHLALRRPTDRPADGSSHGISTDLTGYVLWRGTSGRRRLLWEVIWVA
jgi:hypothetical protein